MRRLVAFPLRLIARLQYSEDRARRYGPVPRLLSTLRRWRMLATHRHARIRFEGHAYLGPGFSVHIPAGGSFLVGPGVEFRRDFCAEIEGDGVISIGAGTSFTYNTVLQCTQSITIGEGCGIGHGVTIVDGQHRFRDLDRPFLEQGYEWHPVTIGDNVAVTSACTVMANIGDRAFIGANSVVTRDIPAYAVAVGAPARVVDQFAPGKSPGAPESEKREAERP